MSLEAIVMTYGYPAIVMGSFLEGEVILVVGGMAAHAGYLELPWVMLCAFVGTLFGDQLYYYLGRSKGMAFLERRPHWQAKTEKVFDLLHRHQILLLLGFRFLYGIRVVTPFIIGAAGIPPRRFVLLNFIGAAVWAVAVGYAGFAFGQLLQHFLEDVHRYTIWIFLTVAVATAIVAWWHLKKQN